MDCREKSVQTLKVTLGRRLDFDDTLIIHLAQDQVDVFRKKV